MSTDGEPATEVEVLTYDLGDPDPVASTTLTISVDGSFPGLVIEGDVYGANLLDSSGEPTGTYRLTAFGIDSSGTVAAFPSTVVDTAADRKQMYALVGPSESLSLEGTIDPDAGEEAITTLKYGWIQTGRIATLEESQWKGARMAVEAMGLNRWFVNACQERGYDIIVDAGDLNLRSCGKKTDRRDAREISRRLWLGDLDRHSTTYYPTDEEYGIRSLERVRHDLVDQRTHVSNRIRALLDAYKIALPKGVLYPALRAADLFVLPSRREGFSNVLLEALAVGTPARVRLGERAAAARGAARTRAVTRPPRERGSGTGFQDRRLQPLGHPSAGSVV